MPTISSVPTKTLTLVRPTVAFAEEFDRVIREFRQNREINIEALYDRCNFSFPEYLQRCQDAEIGKNLPNGYVPSTTFWLVRNNTDILGISHLRHHLSPGLRIEGGHIGYSIRPSQRRKGYGTQQLSLLLDACRQFEMQEVMITCDFDNWGSIKIIEKNGGKRTGEALSPFTKKKVYHYWIYL